MVIGKQFLTDILISSYTIVSIHLLAKTLLWSLVIYTITQKELGKPCVMTWSKKLETIFAYKLVGLYMLQRGLAKNPIRIRYSPLWTVLEVQHGAHFKLGITLGSKTKNIYLNTGFHINNV